jgi:hypothetical protein
VRRCAQYSSEINCKRKFVLGSEWFPTIFWFWTKVESKHIPFCKNLALNKNREASQNTKKSFLHSFSQAQLVQRKQVVKKGLKVSILDYSV